MRLDHLLSKECYWLLSDISFEGISPITTQLNTGYLVALASPADDLAAFDEECSGQRCCSLCPQVVEARLSRDRSLRVRSGSCYFVLRERPFGPACLFQAGRVGRVPGDVLAGLLISVAARVPLCRMLPSLSPRELLVSSDVGCGACVVLR